MLIAIALATFVSTSLGGLFALRFKDRLHLVLGFSAGAVLGVAFFDLIPEALDVASQSFKPSTIMTCVAIGFFLFMILDRLVVIHHHEEEEGHTHQRGILGASSLSIHSLLDGIGIGLAFQVSSAVGIIVAVAVLTHDFSDGLNTVNVISKNGGDRKNAFKWLFVDAIAPLIGVISTFFFTLSPSALGIVLALFSGFFLYIGASDLLPESHHAHPKAITIFTTLLGAGVLYLAIHLAGL